MNKNKLMMQYFEWYLKPEDRLWKKVTKEAENLAKLGITDIWLPPAYKGAGGKFDTGYGVYDLYDLGEFNQKGSIPTKYGSKDEYLEAIEELHNNNIKVYADIVLNHKMGADESEVVFAKEQDAQDRNINTTEFKQIVAWTKYNFLNRNNKYSDFKWNHSHFDGTDWDEKTKKSAIYKFSGKLWDDNVDKENGNYDYLMGADIDFSNPEVIQELKKWGEWYLDFTKVDAFRLDAVKHISARFMSNWIENIRDEQKLECVGEYWSLNIESLNTYLEKTNYKIPLFDVPLHYHFYQASNSNGSYDMRNMFQNTLSKTNPGLTVTFVDNHDTQPGQALFSWVQEWFKPLAYALILLRREGLPCIFYGDFYGIPSHNVNPMGEVLEKLITLRKEFAYGEQIDYFDHPNVVAWVRTGDGAHENSGLVAIMSDGPGGGKMINVGKEMANSIYYDYTGNIQETVYVDQDGNGIFYCNGGSVSVWVRKEL